MKFSFSLILLLSFLVFCTTSQERALEATLTFAGTNSVELEKVLHHYKDESATKITVDRTEYDFGTFPMSESQECFFRITNTGSSLLMVHDVVTSCGCTKVEYDKHPVPPGQTMDLKVIYEAEESGRFTKVVTVY